MLQVTGCNFDHDKGSPGPPAPSLEVSGALKYAVITGNVGRGGVRIINKGVPERNVVTASNQPPGP
jgi:hypothetical protein